MNNINAANQNSSFFLGTTVGVTNTNLLSTRTRTGAMYLGPRGALAQVLKIRH